MLRAIGSKIYLPITSAAWRCCQKLMLKKEMQLKLQCQAKLKN